MDDRRTVDNRRIVDRGHMNFYVAGQRPLSASDVPTNGTATYAGHVIANVRNGNNSYIAGANFTNTVNFGAANNQLSVAVGAPGATFDGATYSGSLSLKADRRDFGGSLAGAGDGLTGNLTRTMTMDGSFFKGTAGPVGEMGGNVSNASTGSTGYVAGGIFVGKKQ
jgi:hypothetical protein